MMNVKFLDLEKQYQQYKSEIDLAMRNAFHDFNFVKGSHVFQFERQFASILGVREVISTGNGTDAIFAGLKCLGVQEGDEVITPAFSWISTSETISLLKAKPIFVDVESDYYTMSTRLLEEKITGRTKGIIAVHLYGQAADIETLNAVCKKHKIFLLEDCSQAHLTEYNGKFVGSYGDAGAFSFYPTKNLGAYGDAGCLAINNAKLAEMARRFLNHGALNKEDHLFEGTNSRMDTIQAAVLLVKLSYLKLWNEIRNKNAGRYSEQLEKMPDLITPAVRKGTSHTFNLYVVKVTQRDALQKYLFKHGIHALIHYPKSLPNLPAYKYLEHRREDFPVSSKLENEVLSLPVSPQTDSEQIDYTCEKIKAFYGK